MNSIAMKICIVYYGIRNDTLQTISAWLSGRTQKVVLDGVCSDPDPVLCGVPPGSVLGSILFLIFINDLPDNINSTVSLFVDDCVLYRNIRGSEDQQLLQDDLEKLALWEEAWLMKINVANQMSLCESDKAPPPSSPPPPPPTHTPLLINRLVIHYITKF